MWKDGELVVTTREPSDRLLAFLITTLGDRHRLGSHAEQREAAGQRPRDRLPEMLDALTDSDCPTEFITAEDMMGATLLPPPDEDEPMS